MDLFATDTHINKYLCVFFPLSVLAGWYIFYKMYSNKKAVIRPITTHQVGGNVPELKSSFPSCTNPRDIKHQQDELQAVEQSINHRHQNNTMHMTWIMTKD